MRKSFFSFLRFLESSDMIGGVAGELLGNYSPPPRPVYTAALVCPTLTFRTMFTSSTYNLDSEAFEPTYTFDYKALDESLGWAEDTENMISMSDCAAALSLIIQHCLESKDLRLVGAKLAALAIYLDPVNNSKFGKTLSEIAANAGVTRASLSKSLLSLRDGAGLSLTIGKRAYACDSYKRSQAAALKAGVHVSQVRKKKLASA